MADSRCEELLKISTRLFEKKAPKNRLDQEIAELYHPLRADFDGSSPIDDDFVADLMDGTPILYRESLGNMPEAMLRQGNWFTIGTGDPERDRRLANRRSLDMATTGLRRLIGDTRAQFAIATKEADHDWVTFGNPVMSVEPSDTREHLLFRAWHPGKCAWMVNDANEVVAVFRKVTFTARDIVRKKTYGAWNGTVSPEVHEAAKIDPMREFQCLHILMRSDEVYGSDKTGMRRINQPFVSIYLDCEHRTYLHDNGRPVFNYVVPRNRMISGKPWGFSPHTLNSLQDARMLQSLKLILLEQGEKAVDPPVVARGDIFTRDVNLFSGGFTAVDLPDNTKVGDVITTLETGDKIGIGIDMVQDVRALIAESMLVNKLMLPSVREMRELEVATRNEEFRRTALPFFSPIDSQYHSPLLSTAFDVGVSQRMIRLDDFPKELDGEDVKFTFESPLNEVEGRKLVEAFFTDLQMIAAAAEVDETVKDLLNMRTATVDALQGAGTPSAWFGTDEERRARAQKAEEKSGLLEAADIAQRGAGVVSDMANANLSAQQAGMI